MGNLEVMGDLKLRLKRLSRALVKGATLEGGLPWLGWWLPACPSPPAGVPAQPAPRCQLLCYWKEPHCPVPRQILCGKTSGCYLSALQPQLEGRLGSLSPRGQRSSVMVDTANTSTATLGSCLERYTEYDVTNLLTCL